MPRFEHAPAAHLRGVCVADGHARGRGRGRGRGRQRGRGIGINLLIFSSLLTLGAREFVGAADAAVTR